MPGKPLIVAVVGIVPIRIVSRFRISVREDSR